MNFIKKEKNHKPIRFLGGLMASLILLFGASACNSGTEEREVQEDGLATEEPVYDTEIRETENEVVANEEVNDFSRWDSNRDEYLDEREFETVANDRGFYDEWDRDEDGAYNEDELNEGIYNAYDEDNDGVYSNEEFISWNIFWGGDYDFTTWDTNQNNEIDAEEYNTGVRNEGVYNDWDEDNDGVYTRDEVNRGLFTTGDADEDGNLADEEYENMGYNLWGL